MADSYDHYTSKVAKSVTPKMRAVLKVMQDGRERVRVDMLRDAGIEPNPMSRNGYPGFEKTDYYLYRHGLVEIVKVSASGQRTFKITEKGLEEAEKWR